MESNFVKDWILTDLPAVVNCTYFSFMIWITYLLFDINFHTKLKMSFVLWVISPMETNILIYVDDDYDNSHIRTVFPFTNIA